MKVILYKKMKDKKKMELHLRSHLNDRGKYQRAATNRRMGQLLAVLGGMKIEKKTLDRT